MEKKAIMSKEVYHIKTVSQYHKFRGLVGPAHPLVSVIDFERMQYETSKNGAHLVFDFYSIALKRNLNGKITYGQQEYDFDEGVLFFLSPGQVFSIKQKQKGASNLSGWMLLVHPDFLWGTGLATSIRRYGFFNYSVHEALFLSDKEESILNEIIKNIEHEHLDTTDKFSKGIIVSQIEALLNYANRFYNRQFLTREVSNERILEKLEALLLDYFDQKNAVLEGIPSVHYVAEKMNLSPDYLSNMLKAVTGLNTQQHIHESLIKKAREKLSVSELSISEIAYELGFEHPQSFSKLFKSKTGFTPSAFRRSFD